MTTVQVHGEDTSGKLEYYLPHSPRSEIIRVELETAEGEGG